MVGQYSVAMTMPKGIAPGWWKGELDKLGEGTVYAPWAKPEITAREVKFLLEVLGPGRARRLLDAGCGFGRHSLLLAEEGFLVTGVDISHVLPRLAMKRARITSARASFVTADIGLLPFDTHSFDCIIGMAEGGIGYKETDEANEAMLAELARVLVPGGRFVIGVINAGWAMQRCPCVKFQLDRGAIAVYRFRYDRKQSRLRTDVCSVRWRGPRFHRSQGWVRLYTHSEMTGILARLGLQITSAYGENNLKVPLSKHSFRMVICGQKRA